MFNFALQPFSMFWGACTEQEREYPLPLYRRGQSLLSHSGGSRWIVSHPELIHLAGKSLALIGNGSGQDAEGSQRTQLANELGNYFDFLLPRTSWNIQ